jgi:hypothetical protein
LLTERDDLRHPLSGPFARESLFHNVVLPEEGLFVFFYTWVDADDRAGRLFAVYGEDDKPLVFDVVDGVAVGGRDFDDWAVAGMTVRHTALLQTAELAFAGDEASLSMTFDALHRAFPYAENDNGCPPAMAEARFEQSGRVQGTLTVAGRTVPFDTTAHRDHSWGARDWNSFHHWKWISGQAGDDVTFNAEQMLAGGREWINGYVNRAGLVSAVIAVEADVTYDDDDFTQRRATVVVTDAAGGTIRIEVERFSLLRFEPSDQIAMFDAGCRGSVDGRPGRVHLEIGWTKDYVAHQVTSRLPAAATAAPG